MLRPSGSHFDAHTLRRARCPRMGFLEPTHHGRSRQHFRRSKRERANSVAASGASEKTRSIDFNLRCSCSSPELRGGSNAPPETQKKRGRASGPNVQVSRWAQLSRRCVRQTFSRGTSARSSNAQEGIRLDECLPRPPVGGGYPRRLRQAHHRRARGSSRGSLLVRGESLPRSGARRCVVRNGRRTKPCARSSEKSRGQTGQAATRRGRSSRAPSRQITLTVSRRIRRCVERQFRRGGAPPVCRERRAKCVLWTLWASASMG
jgi:hypothetical protein